MKVAALFVQEKGCYSALSGVDFMCHEKKGHLCCGWMIALRTVSDRPPSTAPWEFSLTPEQEKALGYK